MTYPLMLRLEDRDCLVVGGGTVAVRKVAALLEARARITVISLQLSAQLEGVAAAGLIVVRREAYSTQALTDLRPLLVFAATDDAAVNRQIAADARTAGALVNVADAPDSSDFENPAVVQRGPLTMTVSTGGASPALAAHLRDRIGEAVGLEYATLARWMGASRAEVGAALDTPAQRAALWQSVLRSPILDLLRRGEQAGARALFERLINEAESAQT